MTKLEELLNEYCPDGVEYKPLGEVCDDFIVPMRDRPQVFDGTVPWCRIEDLEGHYFNKSLSGLCVSEEVIKEMNLKVFPVGTVICSCSASLGVYAINTQPLITNQTFIGLVCGEKIDNCYLRYCMEIMTNKLRGLATTGTIPYISRKKFEGLVVPVPPLVVQREIVRILDNFTLYLAELIAELTARRKQYEFYRDSLLTFDKNVQQGVANSPVQWKKLGEVASIYDGTHQTPQYQLHGIKFVSVENISNPYETKKYISESDFNKYKIKPQINDILMTRIGSIGVCTVLMSNEPLAYYVSLALIRPNLECVVSKFLKYLIESRIGRRELAKKTLVNAVPIKINKDEIGKIQIPIPPLAEQERIVAILDKFDALCNDITAGLPAEIEMRKKQYEYYRDKLLTFKKRA